MPIDHTGAIDEMYGMVNGLQAAIAAIVGYAPEVRWHGKGEAVKPPKDQIWMRVSSQLVDNAQSTLANVEGKRRYEAVGIMYVQLFAPRSVPGSLSKARQIGQLLQDRFSKHSTSGAIWFRRPRTLDMLVETDSFPLKFAVEFQYDTIVGGGIGDNAGDGGIGGEQGDWTLHFPVEAPDGIITDFTFVGLPDSADKFMLAKNGLVNVVAEDFELMGSGVVRMILPLRADDKLIAYY